MTFEELYKATHKYIYLFLYYRVEEKSQIDDLIQDTYLRFFNKNIDKKLFTDEDKKILFGFCRNILREYFRSIKSNQSYELFDNFDYSELYNSEKSKEFKSLNKLQQKLIIDGVKKLRTRVRQVIEFRFFYGMKIKEISPLVGLKERDVMKYQQRGIKYLKKIVNESNA